MKLADKTKLESIIPIEHEEDTVQQKLDDLEELH